jgi:hypothetical protein
MNNENIPSEKKQIEKEKCSTILLIEELFKNVKYIEGVQQWKE